VLRSLLSEYTEFETKAISAGENVKIITGAFAEKEGTLIKFAGNTARVELKTLGISILATVAVDNIKRK
jgi:transcription antitermination factor NusG